MTIPFRLITLFALLPVVACARSGAAPRTGELTAEWTGADTGGLNARPHVVWCERDRRLKITAVKGDAGLGFLIYPDGPLGRGTFPVFDPGVDSSRRPGAAVAGRWVSAKTVAAYQSDSGGVEMAPGSTGLTGKFSVRLKGVNTSDTVWMTGHFGGVTPDTCLTDSPPSGPPGR